MIAQTDPRINEILQLARDEGRPLALPPETVCALEDAGWVVDPFSAAIEQAEPDVLADAGDLLTRFTRGDLIGRYDNGEDHIIVLTSAILAVAAELRSVNNALVDLGVRR